MSNEYKIRTIQDIYNKIPSDKIDVFFEEFKTGVIQAQFVRDMTVEIAGTLDIENQIQFPDEITWIDDDVGDVICNIQTDVCGVIIDQASIKISKNS